MARAAAKTDAITLLKNDHRTVEELFESFENTSGSTAKEKIAKKICLELSVHTAIEEEIFYPAVKDVIDEEMYSEAQVEHDGAKGLIAEILAGNPDDEFYDASLKVLSEMIKHHVKEEEQRDGMFAQVKKSDLDLDALGGQLAERKAELTARYGQGIPTPETRTRKGAKLKVGHPIAA